MTDWQIHVPHRTRADSLAIDVPVAALELDGDERKVARELALHAHFELGLKTAGELIDLLESSSPAERRLLLRSARARAGLEDPEEIEGRERFVQANEASRARAAANSPWQLCHEPSCSALPVNELGAPVPVDVRRWWCEQHRHLAAPGDLEPRPSTWRLSESGAIVEVNEHEEAREASAAAARARLKEQQDAARAHDVAVTREHERLRDEAFRRQLPPGVPG